MLKETNQGFYEIFQLCLWCLYQKVLLNPRLRISEIEYYTVEHRQMHRFSFLCRPFPTARLSHGSNCGSFPLSGVCCVRDCGLWLVRCELCCTGWCRRSASPRASSMCSHSICAHTNGLWVSCSPSTEAQIAQTRSELGTARQTIWFPT